VKQDRSETFMKKTKLLVADDDVFFQGLIEGLLATDYELITVADGLNAWYELQRPGAPRLAILDWVMPGLSGPEICRKVRASRTLSSLYLILLTARNNESDIVAGLRSGADDYITKPPMPAELRARIRMGERVLALQDAVKVQSFSPDGPIHSPALPANAPAAPSEPVLGASDVPPHYALPSDAENHALSPQSESPPGGHH